MIWLNGTIVGMCLWSIVGSRPRWRVHLTGMNFPPCMNVSCPQIYAIDGYCGPWEINGFELIRLVWIDHFGMSWFADSRCSFCWIVNRNFVRVLLSEMALRDAHPPSVYKAQASIAANCAPLIHEQVSKSTFPEKRRAGHTNIELWYDASIYPVDPRTWKRPWSCDMERAFRIYWRWRARKDCLATSNV